MSANQPSIIATNPIAVTAAATSFLQAIMVAVAAFDVGHMTTSQQAAVQGLLTAAVVLIGAVYARSRSVSKAALAQLTPVVPPPAG